MTAAGQGPGNGLPDARSEHRVLGRAVSLLQRRRVQILFVVVGLWNTVFAYAEWAFLQYMLQDRLHYLAILVVAWPVAVLNAYFCQRRFVFRSTGSVRTELPRFSLVYIATLIGALVALPILLHSLPFDIYVIQAGYTIVVVVLSYMSHKFYSFRPPLQSAEGAIHEGGDRAEP